MSRFVVFLPIFNSPFFQVSDKFGGTRFEYCYLLLFLLPHSSFHSILFQTLGRFDGVWLWLVGVDDDDDSGCCLRLVPNSTFKNFITLHKSFEHLEREMEMVFCVDLKSKPNFWSSSHCRASNIHLLPPIVKEMVVTTTIYNLRLKGWAFGEILG